MGGCYHKKIFDVNRNKKTNTTTDGDGVLIEDEDEPGDMNPQERDQSLDPDLRFEPIRLLLFY